MNKAKIDESKCRGCGCCLRACPMNNIILGRKKAEIGERCNGCGLCTNYCKFNAIETVVKEA